MGGRRCPRLLRGPRASAASADRGEVKTRLPPARPRAAPGRQRSRPRGRGEVQGGGGGLRGALRPRAPARPTTPTATRACAGGFAPGAGFGSSRTSSRPSSGRRLRLRGAARSDARPGPRPRWRSRRSTRCSGPPSRSRRHEGEREIELPPGTQPDTQYALRGHGLPGSNGGPPGDMVIVVHVIVPGDLSDEQEDLAEKARRDARARQPALPGGDEESFFSRVRRAFG